MIKYSGLLSISEAEKEIGIDFAQAGGPAYYYDTLPTGDHWHPNRRQEGRHAE